jgi:hypothetical protein
MTTGNPDHSIVEMLLNLENVKVLGSIDDLASRLKTILESKGLVSLARMQDIFNEIANNLAPGLSVAERQIPLRYIERAVTLINHIWDNPCYLANPNMGWQNVLKWMHDFDVPPTRAKNGLARNVAGLHADIRLTAFMGQIFRVVYCSKPEHIEQEYDEEYP